MNENRIEVIDNGDGTWTVLQNGERAARLVIVPTGEAIGSLSIDVAPVAASDVQAIVFGADASAPTEGRVDRLRFDSSKPNGQLREGAAPFVCTDLTPKGDQA